MTDLNRTLLTAVNAGKLEAVRALLQNPDVDVNKHQSLHWAVTFGKVEMAKLLIEHGADVNQHGMAGKETPLIIALTHSQQELVAYLLKHGANPNIPSHSSKKYPLAYAYTVPMVELLLSYGAKVNLTNSNDSLLGNAIPRNIEVLRKLLQAGANVNGVDKDGYTPLITAAEQGRDDVVKLLLQYGADVEVRGPSGRSVYEIASNASTKKIIEFHRPAPVPGIPVTNLSAADRVLEPKKVVEASAPLPSQAPQKQKSWIWRMFGKADSNSSPAAPNETSPPQEGLFAKHRRLKASGVSVEQWAAEMSMGGSASFQEEREEEARGGASTTQKDTVMERDAEPLVATAYVASADNTSSFTGRATTATTAAATTTTATLAVPDTERVQQLEARVVRLEKVVEDQSALIAKLVKVMESQSYQKSAVSLL